MLFQTKNVKLVKNKEGGLTLVIMDCFEAVQKQMKTSEISTQFVKRQKNDFCFAFSKL